MKKLKKTSDEELLNLYQSNSEENLLNILLQRHMPQIRQNVRSLVCNKEDVEDLEAVLISFDKFVKHDLDECDLYHGFRSFSEEFIIDG